MPEVTLRPVSPSEKAEFETHFQDYQRELSVFTGARPGRDGRFRYEGFDRYWEEARRMPFFVECDGRRAGLVLLRELRPHESSDGTRSLQVAEIYVFPVFRRRGVAKRVMRTAAEMARHRRLPLTWSAYINNTPAVALYRSVLDEFGTKNGGWLTECRRGIDRACQARYYYRMTPVGDRPP